MSFGQIFGNLVKTRRGIEGLTQQALAVMAFGEESYKTRISELENGRIAKPHPKTVDALAVALNITDETISGLLNQQPHPLIYDNMCDFFGLDGNRSMEFELAFAEGHDKAVLFHDRRLRVDIKRSEYFVEEQALVFLASDGRRRPVGMEIDPKMASLASQCRRVVLIHLSEGKHEKLSEVEYPLKIVR
ncbi:helix-turn-helix domain-containing protein [Aliiroseovarius sp. PTFE2010]|uniref:helix-turn-helix domain-containing protein n=1 Tax=Aliiroseovarius sp. PTFE2010 TaxID=3417190 RepID=UPI003CF89D3A